MVNENECAAAGLDPKKVEAIRRRMMRVCNDAQKLGITVFMGSACSLRASDGADRKLILAHLNISNGDGGDGGAKEDDQGLLRGE
ncbi:hypothetical protein LMG26857_03619 [Achromobacter anxifer]|uniref:hypothetical protein n=1 Tax=Achromobacter anxifer TaxID=1287737 RepID=UPI00155BB4FF|nr:hypothetical protein [Achromobacter anxifer]CAB5514560.1 hypothetical protein LMG26857_03619 [Achromobacter anxifer]